jgi:anti-sigma factor RsiW
MTHPSFEQLDNCLDDLLSPTQQEEVQAHVATCPACAATVSALQALRTEVARLPSVTAVPDGLWQRVRATIATRQVVALPHAGPARRAGWRTFTAAAVALVLVSSATTALLMRRDPATAGMPVEVVPAAWQASEAGYLESVASLRAQLDGQRAALSPATVEAVEAALATIDAAIAEARAVLLADPANATLADLLASNYRQKVDLLRRATQLASTT